MFHVIKKTLWIQGLILLAAFILPQKVEAAANQEVYLYLQNASHKVKAGGTVRTSLHIDAYDYVGPIQLSLNEKKLKGARASFTPNNFTIRNNSSRNQTQVAITVPNTIPAGYYELVIKASGRNSRMSAKGESRLDITVLPNTVAPTPTRPASNPTPPVPTPAPRPASPAPIPPAPVTPAPPVPTPPAPVTPAPPVPTPPTPVTPAPPAPTPPAPVTPAPPVPTPPAPVSITPTTGLKAFPEAVGFGAYASGGRGGDVCIVTNLARDFQPCLDRPGPQIIVFEDSGLYDREIEIHRSDITIAGQTSPSGVIVRGIDTTESPYCDQNEGCLSTAAKASNLIVRHLRTRPNHGTFPDALRIRAVRNAIFDHISATGAEDVAVEVSYASRITIQNTLLGETLGDHAEFGGMLLNYSAPRVGLPLDQISLVRNNWNRAQGRLPELSRESPHAADAAMNIEIINNLLWDPGYPMDVNSTNISPSDTGDPIAYRMNWIGNLSVTRNTYRFGMADFHLDRNRNTETRIYNFDNNMERFASLTDWSMYYCCNDFSSTNFDAAIPIWASSAPLTFTGAFVSTPVLPSAQVKQYVFDNVGAFPRDPMDRRMMAPVCNGVIDTSATNINPANDAFRLNPPRTAPADTDRDGMADDWERTRGLNVGVRDHNGTNLSSEGYTNIEVYLNELANRIVSEDAGADISACRF